MKSILESLRLEEYQGLHHFIAAPQLLSLGMVRAPETRLIRINSTPTIGFRAFVPPQNLESAKDITIHEGSIDISGSY